MSFIFGQGTQDTYESLQAKRRRAEGLRRPMATPDLGSGLSALGRAFAARRLERKVSEGTDRLNSEWLEGARESGLGDARLNILKDMPHAQRQAYMLSRLDQKPTGGGRGPSRTEAAGIEGQGILAALLAPGNSQPGMGAPANRPDPSMVGNFPVADLGFNTGTPTQGGHLPPPTTQPPMMAEGPAPTASLSFGENAAPEQPATQGGMSMETVRNLQMQALTSPNPALSRVLLQKAGLIESMIEPEQAPERAILKGADGFQYFQDNGERVFPNITMPEDSGYSTLTAEQVAGMPGLDPTKAYQRSPDGKISAIGGGGTNIDISTGNNQPAIPAYPKLDTGFAYVRGSDGQVIINEQGVPSVAPIIGGPADIKAQAATKDAESLSEKANEKATLSNRSSGVVLEDIGRLRQLVTEAPWYSPATGFGAGTASKISGSNAADSKALALTIRGNIGFDRLQQMRDASPTGGALGQVSEQELSTLQGVLGSLENSQSEDQFLYNLDRLEGIYNEIMRKAAGYENADQFGFGVAQDQQPIQGPPIAPGGATHRFNPATGKIEALGG